MPLRIRDPFWKTVAPLFRYWRQWVLAVSGAVLSSACFGAGLGMVLPITYLLLQRKGDSEGLHGLIETYLMGSNQAWLREVGEWLAARVPVDPFHGFLVVMVVLLLFAVIGAGGRYIHAITIVRIVRRSIRRLETRMFRRLIQAPLPVLLQTGSHEMINRALSDIDALVEGFFTLFSKALEKILRGLVALILAFWFSWRLTLIALVGVPVIVLLLAVFARLVRRTSHAMLRRREQKIERIHNVMKNIRLVKVQTAEGYERRRFSNTMRQLEVHETRLRKLPVMSKPIVETLTMVGLMAVVSFVAWMIFRREMRIEAFMTTLTFLVAAGASLQNLMNVQQVLHRSSVSAGRLLEVLHVPVEPDDDPAQDRLVRHRESVRFEEVSYTYPNQDKPAITDVGFEVQIGSTLAVVGPNGSGKTTLLSMIPRLFEPDRGRVLIDGVDIARVTLRSLRRQIAVVPQESAVFSGTVAQNIAYGCSPLSYDRIVAAARMAGADDWIGELVRGYETMLGHDGVQLSGGQIQRLAIARAIVRDPAILILDEATSHVDSESEQKINNALRRFCEGRTTFIIAHHLSTVVNADCIVVLDQGRLVDYGCHDELAKRCEIYDALTRTQFAAAREFVVKN